MDAGASITSSSLIHIQRQLPLLVMGLANSWEPVGHTEVHTQPSMSIPGC